MITTTAEPNGRPLAPNVQRAGYGDVRFTLDDVLEMVRHQIVPEDVSTELLNGQLVYRDQFDLVDGVVTSGPKHPLVVCLLADLGMRLNNGHRHLSSQCQLTCTPWHVPIPDALILTASLAELDDMPTAADALCVIEVAYSSYELDVGEKLSGYARAGIRQYVVINLRNFTAEVYEGPDVAAGTYPSPRIVAADGTLELRVADAGFFSVPLADVLP